VPERGVELLDIPSGVAVGVDGSASSLHALRAAAEQATYRRTMLHVVRAWTLRTAPRPPDCPPGAVPSLQEYQEYLREQTEGLVADQLQSWPDLTMQVHVVHATATHALLAAAVGADLLVVGHRGRGGFTGLLLGSVAEQCVRHARCPVLVVRPNT